MTDKANVVQSGEPEDQGLCPDFVAETCLRPLEGTCPEFAKTTRSQSHSAGGLPHEETCPKQIRRKRGGQPGNQNARTHGFYSKTLTRKQQTALQDAANLKGLGQEIAILRVKIDSILANDPDNVSLLIPAMSLLARLLQANQVFEKPEENNQNMSRAFRRLLDSLFSWKHDPPERPLSPAPPVSAMSEVEGSESGRAGEATRNPPSVEGPALGAVPAPDEPEKALSTSFTNNESGST